MAQFLKNYPVMEKAFNQLQEKSLSREELELYNRSKIDELDRRSNEKYIREEAKLEGKLEGKIEGAANSLILILKQKFNEIPNRYLDIISNASLEDINKMLGKAISANKIQDVFN